MKVLVITLALAGLASTATLNAQVYGSRPIPTSNGSINVDGSWRVVGRDGSGNTIYERRTQDRNGNILVQRARRDSRGNMSIISSNTISNTSNRNSTNCSYNQSTNTVGDIIFGRNGSNVNCNDNGTRVDGGWYQVSQGGNNNSIYERRVTDSNGNLIIQRARRNSNGSFTIISSRAANSNDGQWQNRQGKQSRKSQRDDNNNNNNNNNGRGRGNNKHGDNGNQDRGRGNNNQNERDN
jgi:hypothetical protein